MIRAEDFAVGVAGGFVPALSVLTNSGRFSGDFGSATSFISSWKSTVALASCSAWHLCDACLAGAERYLPKPFERILARYPLSVSSRKSQCCIALSPDAKTALVAGAHNAALIDIPSGEIEAKLKLYDAFETDPGYAAFSSNGRWLALPVDSAMMGFWVGPKWEGKNGHFQSSFFSGSSNSVGRPSFSCDGTRIAVGHPDGTLQTWDCASGRRLSRMGFGFFRGTGHTPASVQCLGWSSDSRLIASGGKNDVILWDAGTGEKVRTWRQSEDSDTIVSAIIFSADGARVISAGSDGSVLTTEASSGRELDRTHTEPVVAASANGRHFVCQWGIRDRNGWDQRAIGVWDVIGNKWTQTFRWPWEWFAVEAHISSDGRMLLLAGNDGYVRAVLVNPAGEDTAAVPLKARLRNDAVR